MPERPIPEPDGLNAEWYAHCAKGQLHFQRCEDCQTWRHLPRHMCAACGSTNWTWEASSGRGEIHTWTVTHQAMHPAFADEVPYVSVVVELEEGVRMVSGILGIEPSELKLQLPDQIEFEPVAPEVALPYFRSLDSSHSDQAAPRGKRRNIRQLLLASRKSQNQAVPSPQLGRSPTPSFHHPDRVESWPLRASNLCIMGRSIMIPTRSWK